jgi:hypothetical protein
MSRIRRIVIDKWPTPDGRPFDRQPLMDYAATITEWTHRASIGEARQWMAGIDWEKHLKVPGRPDPLPGVWLNAPGGVSFTVPAHRRVLFFSFQAALIRLDYLRAWGAIGHIETSDPVTWPAPCT